MTSEARVGIRPSYAEGESHDDNDEFSPRRKNTTGLDKGREMPRSVIQHCYENADGALGGSFQLSFSTLLLSKEAAETGLIRE